MLWTPSGNGNSSKISGALGRLNIRNRGKKGAGPSLLICPRSAILVIIQDRNRGSRVHSKVKCDRVYTKKEKGTPSVGVQREPPAFFWPAFDIDADFRAARVQITYRLEIIRAIQDVPNSNAFPSVARVHGSCDPTSSSKNCD